MTGRFATVDPVRDGRNWYVYTANDPVNFIDPWGLAAEDGNRTLINKEYPEEASKKVAYDKDNPIDQRDFDERCGFVSSRAYSVSCYIASMVNIYAGTSEGGFPQEKLDTAVAEGKSKDLFYKDGSPKDNLGLIQVFAASLDRDTAYVEVFDSPKYKRKTMTEAEFRESNYKVGIVNNDRTLPIGEVITHFTGTINDDNNTNLDSYPSNLDTEVVEVRPLREVSTK